MLSKASSIGRDNSDRRRAGNPETPRRITIPSFCFGTMESTESQEMEHNDGGRAAIPICRFWRPRLNGKAQIGHKFTRARAFSQFYRARVIKRWVYGERHLSSYGHVRTANKPASWPPPTCRVPAFAGLGKKRAERNFHLHDTNRANQERSISRLSKLPRESLHRNGLLSCTDLILDKAPLERDASNALIFHAR